MSLYPDDPNANPSLGELQDPPIHRATQACLTCKRQKRKCSKTIPSCDLCIRMNRHCDYSSDPPPPTAEDFNFMRQRLQEVEAKLGTNTSNLGNGMGAGAQQTAYTPGSSSLVGPDSLGSQVPGYAPAQDFPWQGIQNRFPPIAFLDKESFKYGGIAIPKPSVDVPLDVLEIIGDGAAVHSVMTEYFSTVHKWMPIVSQKRMDRNMANPLWEAGSDLALLFLCMKLIISKPQDGFESSQNAIYMSAKRFMTLMEAAGTASLLVLQANLLITWYEYGQAIYPAASMSAGWCIRYANILGINGHNEAPQLLGHPDTWTEQEERKRAWWGVLLVDRVIAIGSQGYILNSQEPTKDDLLPVNDTAWENGDMTGAVQKAVSNFVKDPVAPFARLCQAYIMLGKVFSHQYGPAINSETARFGLASQLVLDISIFSQQVTNEANMSQDYLSLSPAMALNFSALCVLCDRYACPPPGTVTTTEASDMQIKSIECLKTASEAIVEFSEKLSAAISTPHDVDKVSPIIMDALYSAAANSAWQVRESGDQNFQLSLDKIRHTLRKLGTRWRNAAEYLRILEAQEFTYAVGSAGGP